MHGVIWIWQLVVEILILVAHTMMVVIVHIVENSEVVVDVASSVKVLWEEVKPHIIPMWWVDLINRQLFVLPSYWQWKLSGLGIKHGHLSLKELILTSIVVSVFVGHT